MNGGYSSYKVKAIAMLLCDFRRISEKKKKVDKCTASHLINSSRQTKYKHELRLMK